jgi:hypothetical protein
MLSSSVRSEGWGFRCDCSACLAQVRERADAGVRVAKGAPGYSLRLGSVVVLFLFRDDAVNCVLWCFLVGYIGLIVNFLQNIEGFHGCQNLLFNLEIHPFSRTTTPMNHVGYLCQTSFTRDTSGFL